MGPNWDADHKAEVALSPKTNGGLKKSTDTFKNVF